MSLCLRSRTFRLWGLELATGVRLGVRVSGLKQLFISSAMRASLPAVVRPLAVWANRAGSLKRPQLAEVPGVA